MVCHRRKWYTSGRKYPGKEVAEWVGDSTEIQGFQFWLSDKDRDQESGVIVYATDGKYANQNSTQNCQCIRVLTFSTSLRQNHILIAIIIR